MSGPHVTDLQCVRVQRRVDKALTGGCRLMSAFMSSLPIVVHARRRNQEYCLLTCTTGCIMLPKHVSSKSKRELANRPTILKSISTEVLMKLAILPGPWAGHAQEVMHNAMCTPHQADRVANVSKPQNQGRSSSKLMLVSLVKQLYTRSQEHRSMIAPRTITLHLGFGINTHSSGTAGGGVPAELGTSIAT